LQIQIFFGCILSLERTIRKQSSTPEIVTSAMQLYFTDESLRGVQKFIKLQEINFLHVAIYEWVKKYTKLMDDYLNTIKPQVGNKWHADEAWLKINGDRKYLFTMMDNETGFGLHRKWQIPSSSIMPIIC